MKPGKLREMTVEELKEQLRTTRKEMIDLRVEKAAGRLENSARIRLVRREAARITTIIKERGDGLAAPGKA